MIGCWPASFSRLAASVEKPGLRLLLRGEAELVEEHLAQLERGVHVEVVPGRLDDRGAVALDVGDEPVAQALQLVAVDARRRRPPCGRARRRAAPRCRR